MARLHLVLLLSFGLLCASVRGAAAAEERYPIPGDDTFPEGIASGSAAGEFYVGSTTSGTIYRGDTGSGEVEVALPGGRDGRSDVRGIKVDGRGRLYAAGGPTGKIYVYDLRRGELLAQFQTGLDPTFVNDVTIAPDGSAYFTDSNSPAIYQVAADVGAEGAFERWIDLSDSPIEYGEGFNLNGIAASGDGRYLVTVQSNTGKLFRIDVATKQVVEIDLGAETLAGGDGLLLDGRILHVMRNAEGVLVTMRLSADFASASIAATTSDPDFDFPTTIARVGDRVLVVNSQLNKRQSNEAPDLPFEVLAIPAPNVGQPEMPESGAGALASRTPSSSAVWVTAGIAALLASVLLVVGSRQRGQRRSR